MKWTIPAVLGVALLCAQGAAWAQGYVPGQKQFQRPELHLTDEQRERLSRLEKEWRADADRLRSEIFQSRRKLDGMYQQYALVDDRVRTVHRDINEAQARLLEVHLRMQKGLREILTSEQFARLQQIIREDMEEARKRFRRHGKPKSSGCCEDAGPTLHRSRDRGHRKKETPIQAAADSSGAELACNSHLDGVTE
jgi:Spy/CpxP family protein refolding chaperone